MCVELRVCLVAHRKPSVKKSKKYKLGMAPAVFASYRLLRQHHTRSKEVSHLYTTSPLPMNTTTLESLPESVMSHILDNQICMPRRTAYVYIAIIIFTLLSVGIVEWLNGRRVARLVATMEELERNLVEAKSGNARASNGDKEISCSVGGIRAGVK
jgi:hypothetical protein